MQSTDPRGFHVKHNNRLPDGTIEIVYTDVAPLPDPKQTERDRLKVLEDKILDDTITERELVEHERLKLIIRGR